MNRLPKPYTHLVEANGLSSLVLLDGAMQQRLGTRLAEQPEGAISLFANYPKAARALGPWLMSEARAASLGIDGCARGINWLASEWSMADVEAHLLLWMRGQDSASRRWQRLADGRALNALFSVWTVAQRHAFSHPWRAWCYADRNGAGHLLTLAHQFEILTPVSTDLGPEQQSALMRATLADALIHELKTLTALHSSLKGCREKRHAAVDAVLAQAMAAGYADMTDLSALTAWALRTGTDAPTRVAELPALQQQLSGSELLDALDGEAGDAEVGS
ncbi:MAG: DUF4123 domain-containing protein [Pseudomonas sp.]|uniref:DUF4123 domain-containing protein n=1 Tax=Pseudomonas sp. TaxID=306 RepID=UPI002399487D|nr:DUF4123 domain-containing protein [Pseudomonas sp.]MDE1198939.1 DUF4123 domain-containing protein [Pseudomonas sp.]